MGVFVCACVWVGVYGGGVAFVRLRRGERAWIPIVYYFLLGLDVRAYVWACV